MQFVVLSTFVLVFAIISIIAKHYDKLKFYAIFKPITSGLILTISILVYFSSPSQYELIIIPSLAFALLGDCFLLKKKFFLHGLVSFLIAHVGFTLGFVSLYGFCWNFIILLILVVVFLIYFSHLRKNLYKYTVPVVIYMAVIIVMSWQAIGLLLHDRSLIIVGIAIASVLFFFSDALIAYKKFIKPFKCVEVLILSTYWFAIYLFAIAGLYISQ